MGCDLIYIELVKIAENQLAESHTCIINSVTTQSVFANKAKEASVTPVDKGGNDKHTFSKYRPVYLTRFPKLVDYQFLIKLPYALMSSYQFL